VQLGSCLVRTYSNASTSARESTPWSSDEDERQPWVGQKSSLDAKSRDGTVDRGEPRIIATQGTMNWTWIVMASSAGVPRSS
jgi:hypothetical protein